LTLDDLRAVRPGLTRCDERSVDASGLLTVPWAPEALADASFTHVVAARDSRGMMAVACYESPSEGLAVERLGLIAPYCAAPVLRGQTRASPGVPRPAAAPIALGLRDGIVRFAVGVSAVHDAEAALRAAVILLRSKPKGPTSGKPGVRPVAVFE
jgi:hypothetical protein